MELQRKAAHESLPGLVPSAQAEAAPCGGGGGDAVSGLALGVVHAVVGARERLELRIATDERRLQELLELEQAYRELTAENAGLKEALSKRRQDFTLFGSWRLSRIAMAEKPDRIHAAVGEGPQRDLSGRAGEMRLNG